MKSCGISKGLNGMSAERIDDGRERGETTGLQFIDRGDIVCRNPELAQVVGVPGEEDLSSGDATQLRQSGVEVFPVVHRENGECDIKGPVIEGRCSADLGRVGDPSAAPA